MEPKHAGYRSLGSCQIQIYMHYVWWPGGVAVCELYKFPASTLDPVTACTSDFRQGRERHLRDSYAYLANKLSADNKYTKRDM